MRAAVEAPDGRSWQVRRRWVTRLGPDTLWGRFRRRIRTTFRRLDKVSEADPAGCTFDLAEGLTTGIVAALVLLAIVFLAIPLAVALVDAVIVLLLAGLGVVARIALRRPWTIEAAADDGTRQTWRVVGWRAGDEHRRQIEDLLAAGLPLPGPLDP